jgi:hypothetical protein
VKKRTAFALAASRALDALMGFAAAIDALPIDIAPPAPSASEVAAAAQAAPFTDSHRAVRNLQPVHHFGEVQVG